MVSGAQRASRFGLALILAAIIVPAARSPIAPAAPPLGKPLEAMPHFTGKYLGAGAEPPAKPLRPSIWIDSAREAIAPAVPGCDMDCEKIAAVGRWMQAKGFRVSEHPLFGGVSPVHAYGSAHYVGHAIDVNHDNGDEYAALSWLYSQVVKIPGIVVYWRCGEVVMDCSGHYDHLHAEMDG